MISWRFGQLNLNTFLSVATHFGVSLETRLAPKLALAIVASKFFGKHFVFSIQVSVEITFSFKRSRAQVAVKSNVNFIFQIESKLKLTAQLAA